MSDVAVVNRVRKICLALPETVVLPPVARGTEMVALGNSLNRECMISTPP